MANFNLNDYETVEQRLARAYKDHPDMRVITHNLTTIQDRQVSTWVVKAEIWFTDVDAEGRFTDPFLRATGHAFEIDGVGMANKTSALENAETSAIGRALANAGYSGNKRTTREEMEKVQRGQTPQRDWLAVADELALKYDVDGLLKLYAEAKAANAPEPTLEKIKAYGIELRRSTDSTGQPS